MRFEVQANPLAAALARTNLALDPQVRIEAAHAVHLAAAEGGEVRLAVHTLHATITATCRAVIIGPGECAVRATALAGIVASLPPTAAISIETDKAVAKVTCGRASYRLPTIPVLPSALAVGDDAALVEIDQKHLVRALTAPASSCDTGAVRVYLNGICLRGDGATLTACATNGHQLLELRVPAIGALPETIVPSWAAKILGKLLLKTKDQVSLKVSKSILELVAPDFVFASKLIDGRFPDYARVIPRASDNSVTVDRRALISALDRLAAAADPSGVFAPAARLVWDGDGLRLALLDQPDTATDAIDAETTGVGDVAAKLSYLTDIVDEVGSPVIQLDSGRGGAPIRITDPNDPNLLALLMPILSRPNSMVRPGAPPRSQPRHETPDAPPLPGAAGHT